jgi:hypothetical protein
VDKGVTMSIEVTLELDQSQPDSWRQFFSKDHPTFTPIMGFFAGLLFVSLVPGAFLLVLDRLFDPEIARGLSPLMATTLIVPLGLLVWRPSRRFGRYMLLGMVVTAVVVIGVTTLVLWLMARRDL